MKFNTENYFLLDNFYYKDIFNNIENIWEVLPKLEEYLSSLFIDGKVIGNYKDKNNIYIGEGTVIHEDVNIEGPVVIGKNCLITHGSYIRSGCLIGDNVRIGHGVEIKRSIFLNNSIVAHLNYIGDSIIGNSVNIAGGAMLANLRFDKKDVILRYGDKIISTGLQKFGAILGDNVSIGANAVLNPGTLLGKRVIVYPLQFVKGVYIENEIIR